MDGLIPTTTESISDRYSSVIKGPFQVAFDITNKCNFRCKHCYNSSGENRLVNNELTDDEALDFARDITKLKPQGFCFCGGEPLLRFELLGRMLEIIVSCGTGVSMVSNAYLLSVEKCKQLAGLGLRSIQFSLDGATEDTYMELRPYKGAFERVLKAITWAKDAGMQVFVSVTPTRFNASELRDLTLLLRNMDVNTLRIQPLMMMGRAKSNIAAICPSEFQYRELVREIYQIQQEYKGLFEIKWGDPIDHLIRFRTVNQHLVTSTTILADGSIAISPYLPVIVGNIRRHPLSDYWEAGLARIWELDSIKESAKEILSIESMFDSSTWAETDEQANVAFDLIDSESFLKEYI